MEKRDLLRNIPRVDEMIDLVFKACSEDENICTIAGALSLENIRTHVREVIDKLRQDILTDTVTALPEKQDIIKTVLQKISLAFKPSLQNVINATGIVLHTNLGRSPLPHYVADAVSKVATGYSTLEYSLADGGRGSRHDHIESLICKITGAEAAMAVNNNAAAVMLMLGALCKDKEVVVSRGELVEIGGSFRVPEIMSMSGATLKEVGTTNKTKPNDYLGAVNENTAALLKVHTSNFKIIGFSESVEIDKLVELGKQANLPVLYDLGSGLLVRPEKVNIADDMCVQDCIKAGADVVCFSGDKLMGGPQAGIIAGKKKYIDMMKKHQFARVVRIDKLTIAALEATLRLYLNENDAIKYVPVLANLAADKNTLKNNAKKLLDMLPAKKGFVASVKLAETQVGGGSAPGQLLPTYVVAIESAKISASELEQKLRGYSTPVITRVHENRVLIDTRTLLGDEQFKIVAQAFEDIFA
ncbi:MAG: L-seryl-tRNA(Sec) selenium transferase [Clostridia bacterium]|nr:L-seryl-tRNA(Sec) selenium transferase [Clostridia bacterium]